MTGVASTARPDWVSGHLLPFESRFLALPPDHPDHRMHYIDEGKGEPLVFVHGNPAWSFEFRHPVQELRSESAVSRSTTSASASRHGAHGARTIVPRVTRTAWPLCSTISTFARSPCS